ncbi:hypothetical protein MPLA_1410016 [Mesorhizobium sp. ORS 3359]|nr:hypothetical protein MPLA_1410016 [Mesorhizobium sp. ORS 3359]
MKTMFGCEGWAAAVWTPARPASAPERPTGAANRETAAAVPPIKASRRVILLVAPASAGKSRSLLILCPCSANHAVLLKTAARLVLWRQSFVWNPKARRLSTHVCRCRCCGALNVLCAPLRIALPVHAPHSPCVGGISALFGRALLSLKLLLIETYCYPLCAKEAFFGILTCVAVPGDALLWFVTRAAQTPPGARHLSLALAPWPTVSALPIHSKARRDLSDSLPAL